MSATPTPFRVRPASNADAATLARHRTALFLELGELSGDEASARFTGLAQAGFERQLRAEVCLAWLAEAATADAVGSAALLLFPRLPSPLAPAGQEGYLLNVYTLPEWRRRSVGATLVGTAIEKARELGLARIRLHSTGAGRAVYAAAGFSIRENEMELRL